MNFPFDYIALENSDLNVGFYHLLFKVQPQGYEFCIFKTSSPAA